MFPLEKSPWHAVPKAHCTCIVRALLPLALKRQAPVASLVVELNVVTAAQLLSASPFKVSTPVQFSTASGAVVAGFSGAAPAAAANKPITNSAGASTAAILPINPVICVNIAW